MVLSAVIYFKRLVGCLRLGGGAAAGRGQLPAEIACGAASSPRAHLAHPLNVVSVSVWATAKCEVMRTQGLQAGGLGHALLRRWWGA